MWVGRTYRCISHTMNALRKEKGNLIQIEGPYGSSSLFLKPTYLTFLLNEKIFIQEIIRKREKYKKTLNYDMIKLPR